MGEIELMSTTTWPSRSAATTPFSPNSTRSTSGVSGTITKMTSAWRTTAAGLSHATAPAFVSVSGTPLRVNAASATPFLMRFSAMGLPMMPRPMKPAFCMSLSTSCLGASGYRPRLVLLLLHEVFLHGLRRIPEKAHVGTDRDHLAAHRQIPFRIGLHGRQRAACFPSSAGALEDVGDGLLHVRVIRITDMSIRCRQIRRAEEHGVDTVDGKDLIDSINRRPAFDLHHDANVVVCGAQVVAYGAVTIAAMAYRHPANSLGRVSRSCDGASSVGSAIDEGNQEVEEAAIKQPLNHHAVIGRRPHHRGAAAVLERHKLGDEGEDVVGRVLGVEQDAVEGQHAEQFGRDWAAERGPASDLSFALQDRLAKRVGQGLVRRRRCHG